VEIKNGLAIVQMKIDTKYRSLIHEDATAFLRPRSGLEDMLLELNPGLEGDRTPIAKSGFTIPVANTIPTIEADEVLSSLDSDTRAYLDLLVNGAGTGLKDHGGTRLAQVLERFEPTHRDLARLESALSARRYKLQNLMHSLRVLNAALAQKRTQIIQLVNASATVFRAFASQDTNISRAVADLPATLTQTTATLRKVQTFAKALGPLSTNLLPAARAMPAANQAVAALARPSTPIIRDQVRPFVRAARPVINQLRPVAVNLADATPQLASSFVVVNHLFNMLGYHPSGGQHGYLWWLAWLDHNARTLFSQEDANGVFRPLFLQLTCSQLISIANPNLGNPLGPGLSLIGKALGIAGGSAAQQACKAAGYNGGGGLPLPKPPLTTSRPKTPAAPASAGSPRKPAASTHTAGAASSSPISVRTGKAAAAGSVSSTPTRSG
jgi:phospholipid/cholesterol/gamma-HCH transport system substrate-binding protein